jgi:hypothetical protein
MYDHKNLVSLIKQFMPYAQKHIGFTHPPRLFLKQDHENASNPLGKTAYYNHETECVYLYITGRHPKDILRSLGHELVHHRQNCEGMFKDAGYSGKGYAQKNPHLRKLEAEANEQGSMCLRDFTDLLEENNTIYYEYLQKGANNMSTKKWKNGELKNLLSEAWGFKMDLGKLNEGKRKQFANSDQLDGDSDGIPKWADKDDPANKGKESKNEEVEDVEEVSKTASRATGRVSNGDRLVRGEAQEEVDEAHCAGARDVDDIDDDEMALDIGDGFGDDMDLDSIIDRILGAVEDLRGLTGDVDALEMDDEDEFMQESDSLEGGNENG